MASTLQGLPEELRIMIAGYLPQADKLNFMILNRHLSPAGLEALYRYPEIMTLACSDPLHNGPAAFARACERTIVHYLDRAIALGKMPRSLVLREDLTRVEATAHTLPALPLAPTHPLQNVNREIRRVVQQRFPVRAPQPNVDWVNIALNFLAVPEYKAAAIVYGGTLVRLSFQVDRPDVNCIYPMGLAIIDAFNNGTNIGLRELEIGNELVSGPDNFSYGRNFSVLPNLDTLTVGYGTPLFLQPHLGLMKLVLDKWACRTPTLPTLVPNGPHANNVHHLTTHSNLRNVLRSLPNLEHLEIINCRPCNHLLKGYTYNRTIANNPVTVVEAPLGHLLHTSLPRLKWFKMLTACYPAALIQGFSLYRSYRDDLGTFVPHNRMQEMELDCWYFFPGPVLGAPNQQRCPEVTASRLPTTLTNVQLRNLAGGYIMAFYQFCQAVLKEKLAGTLPNLEAVEYNFRNPNESFPLTPDLPFKELRKQLHKAGVEVDLVL